LTGNGADLTGANFERAKVHGVVLAGATLESLPDQFVDASPEGDGSQLLSVSDWVAQIQVNGAGCSVVPCSAASRERQRGWV